MNARTTDSLLARRALAEKATPGEWITTGINSVHGGYRNRLIYPDEHPDFLIASMNNVANPKCTEDADHIAANSPDVVMADIDEILRLRAEVEFWRQETQDVRENFERTLQCARDKTDRLEREADWLAENCWKKPGGEYLPLREMRGGFYCDACPYDYDCRKCWRAAARKAVETS